MTDGFVNGCLKFSEVIDENQNFNAISDALDFGYVFVKLWKLKTNQRLLKLLICWKNYKCT